MNINYTVTFALNNLFKNKTLVGVYPTAKLPICRKPVLDLKVIILHGRLHFCETMQLHGKNAQTGKICQSESVSIHSYALKEYPMNHCFLLRNPQCYSNQNDKPSKKKKPAKRLTGLDKCKLSYIRNTLMCCSDSVNETHTV